MSESNDNEIVEALRDNIERARGSVEDSLAGLNETTAQALNEAVSVADEKSSSIKSIVNSLSEESLDTLQKVLDITEDYITDNDLEITISGNHIYIEGDSEGLRKIETDLEKIGFVVYDREEGIEIKF